MPGEARASTLIYMFVFFQSHSKLHKKTVFHSNTAKKKTNKQQPPKQSKPTTTTKSCFYLNKKKFKTPYGEINKNSCVHPKPTRWLSENRETENASFSRQGVTKPALRSRLWCSGTGSGARSHLPQTQPCSPHPAEALQLTSTQVEPALG